MKAIVYYSYGGNTRGIANRLKERIGCDIFEITPLVAYTSDYNELVEDAKGYVRDNVMPEINEINLDKYDEIILLTPVWWYTYASPINTFLNSYDFSGKFFYPVATNAGWLGHTFEDMEKHVCVKSPLSLVFDDDVLRNEKDLDNWVERLDL